MFKLCQWIKKIISHKDCVCNKQHPYYKKIRCQCLKDHDKPHEACKLYGVNHYLYYDWYDNGNYSDSILKRRIKHEKTNNS